MVLKKIITAFVFIQLFSHALATEVNNLRCEMLVNPIGIDASYPRLSWNIQSKERGIMQTAYQVIVSDNKDTLELGKGNYWNSGKIISGQSNHVEYKGSPLVSQKKYYWKVKIWTNKGTETQWSPAAFFTTGIMNTEGQPPQGAIPFVIQEGWKAKWIGLDTFFVWDDPLNFHSKLSARYFRKEFKTDKKIKQATVYIAGVGLYECYINGTKTSDEVLSPTLSDYSKRVYYNTYNVTASIQQGANAIGVTLGNGKFFSPRPHQEGEKNNQPSLKNFGYPKLFLQLEITYDDNSNVTIVSDTTWKVTADGPIRANNEYDGETYDATKELNGWNQHSFDDSKWLKTQFTMRPGKSIVAQPNPNMKIMQTVKPVSVKEAKPGSFVFDLGQNMAGWVKLSVKGEKGKQVTLRFAQRLDSTGNIDIANLRHAEATDRYILKGTADGEIWEPRFTYHGFRYVEVSGFPGIPDLSAIEGRVVYDEMEKTGEFNSSDTILNKIFKNAQGGISSNYKGIPVNSPERDERMGWIGNRSVGSYGESFIFQNDLLYAKWMDDIKDAQNDEGGITDIAPPYRKIYTDNITQPSGYLFLVAMLYNQYGDLEIIKKHYPTMKKWMMYMQQRYTTRDFLMRLDTYGDKDMPPELIKSMQVEDSTRKTPGVFIASTYFYKCIKMMEEFAKLTGNKFDIGFFNNRAESVKKAINNKFFDKEKKHYANNTITANILALSFDIVPDSLRGAVAKNITGRITNEFKDHISTGVIGGQWLMRGLSDNGSPELAYKIATSTTYPGWGYMVKNGATTLWEKWNGNAPDSAMSSENNVVLLGDLMIWYYEYLAGIKSAEPGFKKIQMNPYVSGNLNFVDASHRSPYGLIKSSWKKTKNKFQWEITIPENSTAEIYIPAVSKDKVRENKKRVSSYQEIKFLRMEKGRAIYQIGSGTYKFESVMK